MPISPILDLVILLTFTYFIGSLILSAINEAIAGTFRLRPRNLRIALENLVLSPDWTSFVRSTLIKSPHIEALMKSQGRYPSYISASNFVLAIIQRLGASQYTSANLTNAINISSLPPRFKLVLSDLAARSQSDLAAFEKELATFYNNAMDRAGGWYKRQIRLILLILGLLISFAFNIDTVRIVNESLLDKQRLATTADNIVHDLKNIGKLDSLDIANDTTGKVVISQTSHADSTAPTVSLGPTREKFARIAVQYRTDTGNTLGYTSWDDFVRQWSPARSMQNLIFKLLGILITAFALQLGSNYWFGLLTKAVDLRAAGKKPNGPPNNKP